MMKVLFIDDEMEKWIAYLGPGLEMHGFHVVGEIFPEKPLQLIRQHNPDVVLLDIRENGVDKGRPILTEIKQKYPDLPVVMLTETLRGDVPLTDPGDFLVAALLIVLTKKFRWEKVCRSLCWACNTTWKSNRGFSKTQNIFRCKVWIYYWYYPRDD